jgi:hypothetical protein
MSDATDNFLLAHYEYFQHWYHWYDKAVSQHRAATILYRALLPKLSGYEKARRVALKELKRRKTAPVRYPHPDMLPSFAMFGSALENAFKGIMVSQNSNLIHATKLSPHLKSHKLVELAGHAGIKLSQQEKRVLEWVTEVMIWKARYSVPTDSKFADEFFDALDNTGLADAKRCRRILDAVLTRAKKAMPKRKKRTGYDLLVRLDERT